MNRMMFAFFPCMCPIRFFADRLNSTANANDDLPSLRTYVLALSYQRTSTEINVAVHVWL